MPYGQVLVDTVKDSLNNVLAPASAVFRNRIINGAMVIDQRNAGASVTPTDGQYTLDRWKAQLSQTGKFSAQQSTTSPLGFVNSQKFTSLSAYTVSSSDYFNIAQYIEGYNVADLGWGTANAKTVTLSFWVYSSLTGTFGGSIINATNNRSYPFSYSIPVANTWIQASVTIVGDTTGTWATDNTSGPQIRWSLGTGSSRQGTAGAWVSSQIFSVTGEQQIVATNGATFYITGVQLEVGTNATSFDYRPYGTELALCQRYYYQWTSGIYARLGVCYNDSTTSSQVTVSLPVTMRTTPTTGWLNMTANGTTISPSTIGSNSQQIWVQATGTGLTVGAAQFYASNASNLVAFTAEL